MRIERRAVQTAKQSNRPAAGVFKLCPRCASPNVLKFEGEIFCNFCGWDSVQLSLSLERLSHQEKNTRETYNESNQYL